MKKKTGKKKKAPRKSQDIFSKKLQEYCELLDKIIEDYSRGRVLPFIPDLESMGGESLDIFSWYAEELKGKDGREMAERLRGLRLLRGDISSLFFLKSQRILP